jgi:hypothetical protein
MAVNNPSFKGVSTIQWGTTGRASKPATAIVESIDLRAKNEGSIAEIENGDGATVADVLLDDGFDGTITIIYDSSLTLPALGEAVVVTWKNGVTYSCYTTSICIPSFSKKKEATAKFSIRYRPGITS